MLVGLLTEIGHEMMSSIIKRTNPEQITLLYIVLVMAAVGSIFGFVIYLELFFFPKVIMTQIPNVPINNNTYPILLQALIIVGGVVLGLISSIFIETFKKIGKINLSRFVSTTLLFILLSIFLISAFLIIISILFSINGMSYYSIVNTYITTQINTGTIHTEIGGNVILINSAYFNNNKSNVTIGIKNYYTSLVSVTKIAISTLAEGFVLWLAFVVAYASISIYLNIIKKKQKPNLPPPPPSSPV